MLESTDSSIAELAKQNPKDAAILCREFSRKTPEVLEGGFIPPNLSAFVFQDKGEVSGSGTTCFLVQWESEQNSPGFVIWKLNETTRLTLVSPRIEGCCEALRLLSDDKGVEVTVWRAEGTKKLVVMNFQPQTKA